MAGNETTDALHVSNLNYRTDTYALQQAFPNAAQARVVTDRETGRSRGFGFVTFPSAEVTKVEMDHLGGPGCMMEIDGRECKINFANPRSSPGEKRPERSSTGGGRGYGNSRGGGGYGGGDGSERSRYGGGSSSSGGGSGYSGGGRDGYSTGGRDGYSTGGRDGYSTGGHGGYSGGERDRYSGDGYSSGGKSSGSGGRSDYNSSQRQY